jgi:hypothetical protein
MSPLRFLAAIFCLAVAPLQAVSPPKYAVSLGGLYSRPFLSSGYSIKTSSGMGGFGSFEYRGWNHLAIGALARTTAFDTNGIKASYTGLDFTGRYMPFGAAGIEPYLLLGLGMDIAASADRTWQDRGTGLVATAGLGAQYVLTKAWAVDLGAVYNNRPATQLLHTMDARLALQYRFGETSAKVLQLRNIQATVPGREGALEIRRPGEIPDPDIKTWKLQIRDLDGKLVKTIEGKGALPGDLDLKSLAPTAAYTYSLQVTALDGRQAEEKGEIKPRIQGAELRGIQARVPGHDQPLELRRPGNLADTDIKSWKLQIRDSDGNLVKTLEGKGAMPSDLDLKELSGSRDYKYSLQMRTLDGRELNSTGDIEAGRAPAEATQASVVMNDTLWNIAGRAEIYGDPLLYFLLYDANQAAIKDPDKVYPGMVLKVPRGVDEAGKRRAIRRALAR